MFRLPGPLLALALTLPGCGEPPPPPAPPTTDELAALSANFTPRIVEVVPGVHVASGYGLANSVMVEGEDGLLIIDTMESLAAGQAVRAAFRAISPKPVRGIVYTHNHADHVFGAAAFIDPGVTPEIYAHEQLMPAVSRIVTELRPAIARRSLRMFGQALDDTMFSNSGIGPRLAIDADSAFAIVPPTRTFSDRLQAEVAGIRFELVHAPGETDDQLFVWLPERRLLLPGDNIYRAFPNLYTIRGTAYRPIRQWADSLLLMRALGAEHMIPAHTAPVSGRAQIARILTDYHDAIRYVHDQSIRWINAGLSRDEVAARVQLPPHLAASPWLAEFYGKVEWSARAVFDGNLGWFDGNPSGLLPLRQAERARRMAALAGGADGLRRALAEAAAAGDHQWALELSDHLLELAPDDRAVREARVAALLARGAAQSNPNARHYYLSSALELRDGSAPKTLSNATPQMLAQLPVARFFDAIAVNLRAEACLELDRKLGFHFTDSGEQYTVWIRRGVAEIQPRLMPDAELEVAIDSLLWKQLLARQVGAAGVIATGIEMRRGSRVDFARFLALFRPEDRP